MLDSASEINFVTAAACKQLDLRMDNVYESINGLNNMNCSVRHACQLKIKSRVSDFELNLQCLVLPKITKELPLFSILASQLSIPENLKLADTFFYNPSIDALVGGEFFLQLLLNGRIELGENLPTLQNSKFGWMIASSVPEHLVVDRATSRQSQSMLTCLFVEKESVDDTLSRFWNLEECQTNKHTKLSNEERDCEKHFVNTMIRDVSGQLDCPFETIKISWDNQETLRCGD